MSGPTSESEADQADHLDTAPPDEPTFAGAADPEDVEAWADSDDPYEADDSFMADGLDAMESGGSGVPGDLASIFGERLSPQDIRQIAALTSADVEDLLTAPSPPDGFREVDFQPVIDEIQHLRDSLASYQGLEHSMVELSQTSESTSLSITNYLDVLFDEISRLRRDAEITRDATLVFTNTVRELVSAVSPRNRNQGDDSKPRGRLFVTLVCFAVLVAFATIGWAAYGFQRTGELQYAVLGLLVVNLVTGGALLWFRRS